MLIINTNVLYRFGSRVVVVDVMSVFYVRAIAITNGYAKIYFVFNEMKKSEIKSEPYA